MKLTKIIATIGPSCQTEEKITQLINEGVDIFRFNLKHNLIDWHKEKINLVIKASQKLKKNIGILIDLQGPEIRLKLPKESLSLKIGDKLILSEKAFLQKKGLSFSHPQIINELKNNNKIIVDDGRFHFLVKKEKETIILISQNQGKLGNLKSVTIPNFKANLPLLTEKDFEGIKMAEKINIDFIALSFIRTEKDVEELKKEIKKLKIEAKIIAKIETKLAIKNLDKILKEADGVMVARGDLGVEMPLTEVAFYQKEIIKKAIIFGKPVITATQMLESMINNSSPTRAEISDITNACFDGTDATMLSGETANGAYPKEAVFYMRKTLEFIEKKEEINLEKYFSLIDKDQERKIIYSAYKLYQLLKKNHQFLAFLVFTQSGKTAKLLSFFRPRSPIFAVTSDKKVSQFLTLHYGVFPYYDENALQGQVTHQQIKEKINFLIKNNFLKSGTLLIVLHGDIWGKIGGTSTIKIVKI